MAEDGYVKDFEILLCHDFGIRETCPDDSFAFLLAMHY